MIRAIPCDGVVGFNLLSTDEKPTQYIKTGSMVFETDTQDKYYFDEVSKNWYKYTGPNLDFYCKLGENVYGFFGLSTDEKPEGFGLGSRFVEVDTSKAYILSNDGWKEAKDPEPTPPGPTPTPVLQDKTVDPTTSEQEVTCDSGYDGLGTVTVTAVDPSQYYKSEVSENVTPTTSAQVITPEAGKVFNQINVSAVTSSIDNNIQATNIKKNVTILGIVGTYEGEAPQPVPTTSADAVILLIDNLPAPALIIEDDRVRIHSIRETYETLSVADKALVTNYSKLEACETALPPAIFDLDFTDAQTISDLNIDTTTHIIFHDPYYDLLIHCDVIADINNRGLKYNAGRYFEVFNNSKKTFSITFTFVSNYSTGDHYFEYGTAETDRIYFGTTPVTYSITLEPGQHIQFTSGQGGGAFLSKFYCII